MRVDEARLEAFAGTLLEALGTPSERAERVAASLVGADLRGHRSHGTIRLPQYAEMIADDAIDPTASPDVVRDEGVCANVEGNRAFGQLVGRTVVDLGVGIAAERGASVVGVREAAHMGRIGEWAERATAEGMVLAAFVNTGGGARSVAPAGSAQARLSTNPVAVGVPSFGVLDHPVVLDMATSQVANGKIREKEAEGRPLPEGWLVDETGAPVCDPGALDDPTTAMLPLGGALTGHKGFGLAVVAELLAGIVGDSTVAGGREEGWFSNGAAFVVVDPTRFLPREDAAERVATLAEHLRATDPLDGETVMLPGEPEHRTAARRRREGIPLPPGVVDALADLAAERGVEETPF